VDVERKSFRRSFDVVRVRNFYKVNMERLGEEDDTTDELDEEGEKPAGKLLVVAKP
jgi:hypothetical protein